jgi:hypothetical protein
VAKKLKCGGASRDFNSCTTFSDVKNKNDKFGTTGRTNECRFFGFTGIFAGTRPIREAAKAKCRRFSARRSFFYVAQPAFSVHHAFRMPIDHLTEEDTTNRSASTSYREFLADREDLLRHKWLMSEKAGRDVGLEMALLDWVGNCRVAMRKQR